MQTVGRGDCPQPQCPQLCSSPQNFCPIQVRLPPSLRIPSAAPQLAAGPHPTLPGGHTSLALLTCEARLVAEEVEDSPADLAPPPPARAAISFFSLRASAASASFLAAAADLAGCAASAAALLADTSLVLPTLLRVGAGWGTGEGQAQALSPATEPQRSPASTAFSELAHRPPLAKRTPLTALQHPEQHT